MPFPPRYRLIWARRGGQGEIADTGAPPSATKGEATPWLHALSFSGLRLSLSGLEWDRAECWGAGEWVSAEARTRITWELHNSNGNRAHPRENGHRTTIKASEILIHWF